MNIVEFMSRAAYSAFTHFCFTVFLHSNDLQGSETSVSLPFSSSNPSSGKNSTFPLSEQIFNMFGVSP
jgi:hypothetical protein